MTLLALLAVSRFVALPEAPKPKEVRVVKHYNPDRFRLTGRRHSDNVEHGGLVSVTLRVGDFTYTKGESTVAYEPEERVTWGTVRGKRK